LTGAGVQDLSWKRPKLKFGLQQVPTGTRQNKVDRVLVVVLTGLMCLRNKANFRNLSRLMKRLRKKQPPIYYKTECLDCELILRVKWDCYR